MGSTGTAGAVVARSLDELGASVVRGDEDPVADVAPHLAGPDGVPRVGATDRPC